MIKKTALHILMLFYFLGSSHAQIMNDANSIRKAIENINQVVPNGGSNPPKMRKTAQYKILEQSSSAIWKAAVDNLSKVAPTDNDKEILFQSFEGLSPSEYMQFLNKALDLYSQHKINSGVLNSILYPAGKMQLFVSHNYDRPEVDAFLKKALKVLDKEGDPLAANVEEMRSGKMKQLNDAMRATDPELAKLPIPRLDSPTAPSSSDPTTAPRPSTPTPRASPSDDGGRNQSHP